MTPIRPQTPARRRTPRTIMIPLLAVFTLSILINSANAVAPHPKVIEKLRQDGLLEQFMAQNRIQHQNGVCAPAGAPLRTPSMMRKIAPDKYRNQFGLPDGPSGATSAGRISTVTQAIDTIKVLVILVDFSDNPYTAGFEAATVPMFDSLLFSTKDETINNPAGSMTDYFMETSYGTFFIQGVIKGWYRMPRPYAEYVGTDNGLQRNGINAQDLAFDAIVAADRDIADWKEFDQYGPSGVPDNKLDGVFIVHAGAGNEESHLGGLNDIRSHKWNLKATISLDGVAISAYTMEPEESYINGTISPIGVFCHEYGHFLGLPDLYDTDGPFETSEGLGSWSVMASGNFLGSSRRPAGYDCWSKAFVGFLTPIEVTTNMRDVTIPQVSDNPVCYLLKSNTLPAGEYFLVENRQRTGVDELLPGAGLLIYHVDQAANNLFDNNDNENRYQVALEQGDGQNQLAFGVNNSGDSNDPFSANNGHTEFHDLTTPDSRSNVLITTEIAVWDISANSPNMTASFDISYSRPYLTEFNPILVDVGDGDGVIEANDNFELIFTVRNLWADGANSYVIASSPNADITFVRDSINIGTLKGFGFVTSSAPSSFEFAVDNAITPRIDSIYIDFYTDNGLNLIRQGFQIEVGPPQVMIVNADQVGLYTAQYESDMFKMRLSHRSHVVKTSGAINSAALNKFPTVIWYFGDATTVPPTTDIISTMKSYLDNGGQLLISGQNLTEDLHQLDSSFLHNYLHAVKYDSADYAVIQTGVSGSPIGDGITKMYAFGNGGSKNWIASTAHSIFPVDGGIAEFKASSVFADPNSFHAVSYSGAFKVVFFSLPFEAIQQDERYRGIRTQRDEVLERIINFFDDIQTDVDDDNPAVVIKPQSFSLDQNYPNPFNPSTTISYTVYHNNGTRAPKTELLIYNMLGQEVRTLVSRTESPGSYTVLWDGTDNGGRSVASGIYFYRLKRGSETFSRKMALVK